MARRKGEEQGALRLETSDFLREVAFFCGYPFFMVDALISSSLTKPRFVVDNGRRRHIIHHMLNRVLRLTWG